MEGRLRANMLWDSIVRYKTERGALGSKTGYPRLLTLPVPPHHILTDVLEEGRLSSALHILYKI